MDIHKAIKSVQQKVKYIPQKRDVKNKDGSLRYKYCNLKDVMEKILPALEENNLVVSHELVCPHMTDTLTTGNQPRAVKTKIAVIVGDGQASRDVSSTFLLPNSTEMQNLGASISYAKRYNILSLLGLAQEGEDEELALNHEKEVQQNVKAKAKAELEKQNIFEQIVMGIAGAGGVDALDLWEKKIQESERLDTAAKTTLLQKIAERKKELEKK